MTVTELNPRYLQNNPPETLEDVVNLFTPSKRQFVDLPLGVINICSQQREGENLVQAELDKSIEKRGGDVINPIVVAFIGKTLVEDYVAFTNRTWGSQTCIDDFVPVHEGSDFYTILVAGHSRREAAKRDAVKQGKDPNQATITAQVDNTITSVFDVLDLQVDENIHSRPAPDRAARLYAEAFLWMKERDPKLTKTAFAKQRGISTDVLRDVLAYVGLPPSIRQFTDDGGLPFTLATELGRAHGPMRSEAATCFEAKEAQEEFLHLDFMRFITWFNSNGRQITNTRARIRQYAQALREKHRPEERAASNLEMFDPSAYDQDPRIILRKEIIANLKAYQSRSNTRANILHKGAIQLFSEKRLQLIDGLGDFAVDYERERVVAELAARALAVA